MNTTQDVSYPIELLSGLTAGTVQVLITNPAEIVKVRLQVQGQEIAKLNETSGSCQQVLFMLSFYDLYSLFIFVTNLKSHLGTSTQIKPKGTIDVLRELGPKGYLVLQLSSCVVAVLLKRIQIVLGRHVQRS